MQHDLSSEASQLRLSGGAPPLLAELAAVLPPSRDLADRLVTEFAPTAATLSTPRAYWVGLNGWMTDQGLIYIFYGRPDRSYKFKDGEIWVYTRQVSQVLEFAFVRKVSRFGNYLELKRPHDMDTDQWSDPTLKNAWNEQSARWRRGTILND